MPSRRSHSLKPQPQFLLAVLAILTLSLNSVKAQNYSIQTNFSGSSFADTGISPPDSMGAVGTDHIVELINGRFAAYDRSGTLLQSSTLDSFWASAGVTPTGAFSFDPRIVYDQHSERWFSTAVDNAQSANNILVGVSNSSDPTAGWTAFAIDSDADDSHWADFPMLGLNQDNVVISSNMFSLSAGGSTNLGFHVIDKSDLVSGTLNLTAYEDVALTDTGFSPQPVFDYTNGTGPLTVLSSFNKGNGFLKTSTVDQSSLNTTGGFISVTARPNPTPIDQPGPKADIDAGSSHFSSNIVRQQITGRANDSLWGVQGVDINGRAALEWYEIDALTNAVLQSGIIDDPSLALNFGSISVNEFGDVVIGFSGGDPSTFMSTYFVAGQTVNGVTAFDVITQTQAGVSDYEQNIDSFGRNRWGDYSATVLDPNDPRSFWTFQQYASGTDEWAIQITQVSFVPEPSAVGFILCGALGFFARRQRRTA